MCAAAALVSQPLRQRGVAGGVGRERHVGVARGVCAKALERKLGGVEARDGLDAALPLQQCIIEGVDVIAKAADAAKAGNDNTLLWIGLTRGRTGNDAANCDRAVPWMSGRRSAHVGERAEMPPC